MTDELELFAVGQGTDLTAPEARAERDRYGDRTDVLDKVKALRLLPNGVHLTAELVADYYEVPTDTVKKLVQRNREEMEANGYRLLVGAELRDMLSLSRMDARTPHLGVFDRRAVVRVGLLLRDSPIARRVRDAVQDGYDAAGLPDLSDPLLALQQVSVQLSTAIKLALAERQRAQVAEARAAELEPLAEGYRHFLESDGTVKWANACDHLGVAPNLFGAYLRERKILITDEFTVDRDGVEEKRQGERHNRPYADFKHWFAFPAYGESERLDHVPVHRRYDRRVTSAGMDGLLRVLKRHVVECGRCSLCASVHRNKPTVYAAWRPEPPQRQIGA
ncbi:MAG TPA: phage antirepressor KilAC domain-containing protein [Actinophytocola sp.]|uniref:phage antirepressor KilAC domain-containing protein n=1 Tax=Actinophytocola sp. TaxID=1872138 RepID=UPI002DDCF123|nr:phage antirepressor KilAC domain-containing protein [Actinophytocola sp.]HEV2777883.1 phage antirepressor KilAC domain-containing protein [Actinophytocola sp.]